MTDATASPSVHEYVETFSAAMPPVLRSQTATTLSAPLNLTPAMVSNIDWNPAYHHKKCKIFGISTGHPFLGLSVATLHTRQLEAGLLRREIELCGEFNRLRHAKEEQIRWNQQRERATLHAEERQQLLDAAKEIELERMRRTEEQQQRILAQEKELEEWKHEQAKEVEEQRRRSMEEEDRLRERHHEREMLRLREEAELRLRYHSSAEESSKAIEKRVKDATESMLERLRGEWLHCEAGWRKRVEQLRHDHSNEVDALRQEIHRERQMASSSEVQFSETRAQIAKLVSELEGLRRHQDDDAHARSVEVSLTEMHHKATERLQRTFEEDKAHTKRLFEEELKRMQSVHERELAEMEDAHRAQLRRLETTSEELQHRLRDTETELQQLKGKTAASALRPSYTEAGETRIRDELRSTRRQLNEAVDARERAERLAAQTERELAKANSSLEALQIEFDTLTAQQDVELRSLRDVKHELTDELARVRAAHADEVQLLQKSIRTSESAASRGATKEFETSLRRMTERHEEARRSLEAEKTQLQSRLRELEQRYEEVQRHTQREHGITEGMQRDGERLQQQLEERDRTILELRGSIEELKRTQGTVAELTTRNRALQQELERRNREHEASLKKKDNDAQELCRERAEAQRRAAFLQEELEASQRMRDDEQLCSKRLSDELELRERQLIRDVEEAREVAKSWKDHCTQLQTQAAAAAAASTPKTDSLFHAKEKELLQVRATVDALMQERTKLEQKVYEGSRASTLKDQELLEARSMIDRLNTEVATLREKLQAATRASEGGLVSYPTHSSSHAAVATPPVTTAFTASHVAPATPTPTLVGSLVASDVTTNNSNNIVKPSSVEVVSGSQASNSGFHLLGDIASSSLRSPRRAAVAVTVSHPNAGALHPLEASPVNTGPMISMPVAPSPQTRATGTPSHMPAAPPPIPLSPAAIATQSPALPASSPPTVPVPVASSGLLSPSASPTPVMPAQSAVKQPNVQAPIPVSGSAANSTHELNVSIPVALSPQTRTTGMASHMPAAPPPIPLSPAAIATQSPALPASSPPAVPVPVPVAVSAPKTAASPTVPSYLPQQRIADVPSPTASRGASHYQMYVPVPTPVGALPGSSPAPVSSAVNAQMISPVPIPVSGTTRNDSGPRVSPWSAVPVPVPIVSSATDVSPTAKNREHKHRGHKHK